MSRKKQHTFNRAQPIQTGFAVTCRFEPSLGVGTILKLEPGKKPVLVEWASGLQAFHAEVELKVHTRQETSTSSTNSRSLNSIVLIEQIQHHRVGISN